MYKSTKQSSDSYPYTGKWHFIIHGRDYYFLRWWVEIRDEDAWVEEQDDWKTKLHYGTETLFILDAQDETRSYHWVFTTGYEISVRDNINLDLMLPFPEYAIYPLKDTRVLVAATVEIRRENV